MSNIETVKRMNEAAENKDYAVLKSFLHSDFSFKDPTMTFDNPQDYIEYMESCPFDGTVTAAKFMEDGDTVIQVVDCAMTKPAKFNIHMCDILTFRDGKVYKEESIFDTAQIPEQAEQLASQAYKKYQSSGAMPRH